jgi:hypothetical protein
VRERPAIVANLHADHGHVGDGGVGPQAVLDLERGDVLAAGDDHAW